MKHFRSFLLVFALIITFSFLTVPAACAYSMPYYIDVDLSNNIVTVYSDEDDSIVRQMICSSGTYIAPSPTGVYFMPQKYKEMERTEWYRFEDGYGKFGSRIWDKYLFHSYLFDETDEDTIRLDSYAAMGTSASHGCIRLYIEDAKWIAENCMPGTMVDLFHSDKRDPYIKERLYGGTFTTDSGLTYEQYMSMAENEGDMGYSCKGENVAALQRRLIELGLYDGKADGYYSPQMVRTVKALQTLLGMNVTGIADAGLVASAHSDACPVSGISTLSEGMTGEPVSALQSMLISLGLFESMPSGRFDEATVKAVSEFQVMKGYMPDGIATAALQAEILATIETLAQRFGEGNFDLIYEEKLQTYGTVNSQGRLNVRAEDTSVIGSVEPGAKVEVVEFGQERTLITYQNGKQGYVSTPYLTIAEEIVKIPKYERTENTETALPALRLSNFARTHVISYGSVNIGSNLRIRSAADTESDILFLINPGDTCRILSTTEDGWAHVRYGNKTGYAMTKYFNITTTTEITGEFAFSAS